MEISGETEHAYSARETPMLTYLNVDGVLEERRKEAGAASASGGGEGRGGDGPRIALVGPTDVGKSTLSKILCNYAAGGASHQSPPFQLNFSASKQAMTRCLARHDGVVERVASCSNSRAPLCGLTSSIGHTE